MRFQRVVLVDDSEDDNFINRRFLELAGWTTTVDCFEDPTAALPRLLAEPPDLAFIDLNMPAMSGIELIERLAASDTDMSGCALVVLTSSVREDDRRRAQNTGLVRAYVEKPLSLSTLKDLAETLKAPE